MNKSALFEKKQMQSVKIDESTFTRIPIFHTNTLAAENLRSAERKKAPVEITPPGPSFFCIRLKEVGKAVASTAFSA